MSFLSNVVRKAASPVNQSIKKVTNPIERPIGKVGGVAVRVGTGYVRSVGNTVRHPTFRGIAKLAGRSAADFYTGGLSELGFTAYDVKQLRERNLRAKSHFRRIQRSALLAADETQRRIHSLYNSGGGAAKFSVNPITSPINDSLSSLTAEKPGSMTFGGFSPVPVPDVRSSPTSIADQTIKQAPDKRGVPDQKPPALTGGALVLLAVVAFFILK